MNVPNAKPGGRKSARARRELTVEITIDESPENNFYWRQSLQLLALAAERRRERGATVGVTDQTQGGYDAQVA